MRMKPVLASLLAVAAISAPMLAEAMRWAGAAFLIWYGACSFRAAWRGGGTLRPEGQGARTVLGRGYQDDSLPVFQGHHDRRQTDANAILRPLGHCAIPCARRRRRG